MSTSRMSRRAILAGTATLPAIAVPMLANGQFDPVYAAIERHRAALAAERVADSLTDELEERVLTVRDRWHWNVNEPQAPRPASDSP